jgi:acetyl esterase
LFELGPDQGRRTVDAVQSGPVTKLTVDIEDTTVPGGPSGQVPVRILRPQGAHRPLPVIGYLHSAGWVFGNHHTHDRLIRELAVGAQAAVVATGLPDGTASPCCSENERSLTGAITCVERASASECSPC